MPCAVAFSVGVTQSSILTVSQPRRLMTSSRVELVAISGADPARARPRLLDGAFEELRRIGAGAVPYPYSSHYVAFMVAHLMDEGVLPDRDWDLEQALYEIRGKRLTTVISREGVNMANREPKQYDTWSCGVSFMVGYR
jgi:hypothetical protein